MKRLLYLATLLLVLAAPAAAQDTVIVQTFTLDSASRTGVFQFPDDTTSWRKIFLRYRMRCHDAQVGTGNVGCREWDYNCHTILTDSSRIDSSRRTNSSHAITNFTGNTYLIAPGPTYTYTQYHQQAVTLQPPYADTLYGVGVGVTPHSGPFATSNPQSKTQYLWTAAQLTSEGLSSGPIEALELELSSLGSDIDFLRVRIIGTNLTALDPNDPTVLTAANEVYFLNTSFSSTGWQRLHFHTPFNWNGTDNIIVEFSFDNPAPGTDNPLLTANMGNGHGMRTTTSDAYLQLSGAQHIDIDPAPLASISSQVTVAFWAYGAPNLPQNTSIFEATNATGARIANVHLPWSDGRCYWDCGGDANGYDRIDIPVNAADYKGRWTHWAFTKNATTGTMQIYKDGVLFHSGTGKTKPIDIDHFRIGQGLTSGGMIYFGHINDFQIWSVALDAPTIQAWMHRDLTSGHPQYANLKAWYKLDEGSGQTINDASPSASTATISGPPVWRFHTAASLHRNFADIPFKPSIYFCRGTYTLNITHHYLLDSVLNGQNQVISYAVNGTDLVATDTSYYYQAGWTYIYDEAGTKIDSTAVPTDSTINLSTLTYFHKSPARYELLSFITPYGNNLDLGQDGVMWEFDLTDFAPVLNGRKRLSIEGYGNFQEELDLQFVFIEGTPARPVRNIQHIWPIDEGGHFGFDQILNDNVFEPRQLTLDPLSAAWRLRSVITGHGQNGEFIPRWHFFNVNGGPQEHRWQVWLECSTIPVYPQGGTWPFDRAGWCPGDPSLLKEYELASASMVPGQTVTFDYGMDVVANTSESNYRVSNQLVTYGAHNFSLDAAIERVKRPTNETQYARFNPACSEPIVIIRNEGSTPLTSLVFTYNRKGGSTRTYQWTGNLDFWETAEVVLPIDNPAFWQGTDAVFEVSISAPNGGQDQQADNNHYATPYNAWDYYPQGHIELNWKTNNNVNQTTWKLYDENGNPLMQNSPFLTGNTQYTETFVLPAGCYTLRFDDAADNGLYYWFTPANGIGFARMKFNGTIGRVFEPEFGRFFQYDFYTDGSTVGLQDELPQRFFVYPNPSTDIFQVQLEGIGLQPVVLEVYDLSGRKIVSQTHNPTDGFLHTPIDLSSHPAGTYLLRAQSSTQQFTRTLIRQ